MAEEDAQREAGVEVPRIQAQGFAEVGFRRRKMLLEEVERGEAGVELRRVPSRPGLRHRQEVLVSLGVVVLLEECHSPVEPIEDCLLGQLRLRSGAGASRRRFSGRLRRVPERKERSQAEDSRDQDPGEYAGAPPGVGMGMRMGIGIEVHGVYRPAVAALCTGSILG